MQWLITTDGPHAHHYHRMGVARALQYAGHQVTVADIRHQSMYDAFDRLNPDVLWTQSYNLNTPLIECIKNSDCKVFMRGFDFGPMKKDIEKLNSDGNNIMVEFASNEEIEKVKSIADRVSFIFNHYAPSMLMDAMGYWEEIVPVKENMLGFCPFTYGGGQDMAEFKSDVTFIGSYHHRKPALNDYIVGLNQVKNGGEPLNVKIFSTWHWPSEYYCGVIPVEYNKHAYHNAAVCPNVSEDHSRLIGHDVIERIFSILGGGNLCVSDYVKGAEELFPEEMVFAHNKEEFHKLLLHHVNHPEDGEAMRVRAKEKIWGGHTYFHRAAGICDNLGLGEEVDNLLACVPKIRSETT
jgi:hypothetical protein